MPNKKREKTDSILKKDTAKMKHPKTFDDVVDNIFAQTMASVVEMETYPRGKNSEDNDDTQVYYSPRSKKRHEQDPYTVAQHMEDRTVFRH